MTKLNSYATKEILVNLSIDLSDLKAIYSYINHLRPGPYSDNHSLNKDKMTEYVLQLNEIISEVERNA